MVYLQIFARLRPQALLILAGTEFKLFFAGRISEISRRPSYVMDITFKILVGYYFFRFGYY